MQFISARQAWHDAFYNQANSSLASGLEAQILGIVARSSGAMSGNWKKTKEGSTDNGKFRDDSGKQIHRARAGLVQCAIGGYLKDCADLECISMLLLISSR